MTGDELEALAQRLAAAVVCAIVAGLAGAVACAAAGASYGWQRPRRPRDWVPFDRELAEPVGAALN